MNDRSTETRSVVVKREMPFPPEKIGGAVTWTLTPTSTGTHFRMEQSGFRPDQQQASQGAKHGWQKFFANLEQVLARTG